MNDSQEQETKQARRAGTLCSRTALMDIAYNFRKQTIAHLVKFVHQRRETFVLSEVCKVGIAADVTAD
jgi:hypothetical protein